MTSLFAGLRVGYGAFPKALIDYLWRAKQPYNVSVASETAARAALTNPAYLDKVGQRLDRMSKPPEGLYMNKDVAADTRPHKLAVGVQPCGSGRITTITLEKIPRILSNRCGQP